MARSAPCVSSRRPRSLSMLSAYLRASFMPSWSTSTRARRATVAARWGRPCSRWNCWRKSTASTLAGALMSSSTASRQCRRKNGSAATKRRLKRGSPNETHLPADRCQDRAHRLRCLGRRTGLAQPATIARPAPRERQQLYQEGQTIVTSRGCRQMSAVIHHSWAPDAAIPKRFTCGKKPKSGNEWTRYSWLVGGAGGKKKIKGQRAASDADNLKTNQREANVWRGRPLS